MTRTGTARGNEGAAVFPSAVRRAALRAQGPRGQRDPDWIDQERC